MFGAFEVAAALLTVGGAIGVGWSLRSPAQPEELEPGHLDDGFTRPLVCHREPDDNAAPWTDSALLLPGDSRITFPLSSEGILAVVRSDTAWILFPDDLLLKAVAPMDDVVRGRYLGKALHAVRLVDDLYLDLVAAGRWLPLLLAEIGSDRVELRRFADREALCAETGLEQWDLRVPNLECDARPGVSTVTLDGLELELRVAVVDHEHAAVVRFLDQVEDAVEDPVLRRELGVEGPMETLQWTASELLDFASFGLDIDIDAPPFGFVRAAFADHRVPIPDPDDPDGRGAVSGTLNWAGTVARRAGRPREAIGFFDAALSVCTKEDRGPRADLLYNRGYAYLHEASDGLADIHGALRTFIFQDPDPVLVEAALQDFTEASALRPEDPDAWSQIAVVHQLQGDRKRACEAWLRAADLATDAVVREAMLENAERMS